MYGAVSGDQYGSMNAGYRPFDENGRPVMQYGTEFPFSDRRTVAPGDELPGKAGKKGKSKKGIGKYSSAKKSGRSRSGSPKRSGRGN